MPLSHACGSSGRHHAVRRLYTLTSRRRGRQLTDCRGWPHCLLACLFGEHLAPFLLAVFDDAARQRRVEVIAEVVLCGHLVEGCVQDAVAAREDGGAGCEVVEARPEDL